MWEDTNTDFVCERIIKYTDDIIILNKLLYDRSVKNSKNKFHFTFTYSVFDAFSFFM